MTDRIPGIALSHLLRLIPAMAVFPLVVSPVAAQTVRNSPAAYGTRPAPAGIGSAAASRRVNRRIDTRIDSRISTRIERYQVYTAAPGAVIAASQAELARQSAPNVTTSEP